MGFRKGGGEARVGGRFREVGIVAVMLERILAQVPDAVLLFDTHPRDPKPQACRVNGNRSSSCAEGC